MKSGELSGDAVCPTATPGPALLVLPTRREKFRKKSVNRILSVSQNTDYMLAKVIT